MDATIAGLEYILKDYDVKENPYLIHSIKQVIASLMEVKELKRKRWKHDDDMMESCPCGCYVNTNLDSKSLRFSD